MKPAQQWDEHDMLSLSCGECDWFEAKGRAALDRTIPSVRESDVLAVVSKAVSAFANSGGGILVYGVSHPSSSSGHWTVDDGGCRSWSLWFCCIELGRYHAQLV
jgi:hypothetical protein